MKGISETIKNIAKEQKGGFLSVLLGILAAYFIGNKNIITNIYRIQA